MQKLEKALLAISNIESGIKDIKSRSKEDPKNPLKDTNIEIYTRTMKTLDDILIVLDSLKYKEMVKHNRIDEIKNILRSIYKLIPEEDYKRFIYVIGVEFNGLNENSKKEDDKKLKKLELLLNRLPKKTKNYITYSVVNSYGKVRQNGHENNYLIIMKKYKAYKYYSKNLKYEDTIEDDMDEAEKIELIIYALNKISRISINGKYNGINSLVNEFLNKYQKQLGNLKKEKNPKFRDIKKTEEKEVIEDNNKAEDVYEEDNSFGINM